MRRADRITGAVLLLLSVAFAAGALKNYAYWSPSGPGPAFLPFWLGVAMAVLATLLLLSAMRTLDPGDDWLPRRAGLRRLALVLGASVALVALLDSIGMVIGTALFLVVLLRGLDRVSWPVSIAVALGTAGFTFLVFTYWLKVPLPLGVLGF